MPTGKARAELPTPPSGIELTSEPSRRVATLRFSGSADDATLENKENALRSWLQMRSYPSEGRAVHAFYNAPFLPGPLRRNEVMIVLSEEGGMG
jgi:predicted HD phosphohydrolase